MKLQILTSNTILENTCEFINEQGGSGGLAMKQVFFSLLIEFSLQTNMDLNNKEKNNYFLECTNSNILQ